MPRPAAVLALCRVSNLPTVWTNVLAAVALAGAGFSPWRLSAVLLACSCLYAGGMCLNDLLDLPEDRLRRPARPLPSGLLSVRDAWWVTAALFGTALALLALLPGRASLAAGALLLAAILAYDALHRGRPWTVLLMASCRLLVYVVAAVGAAGGLGWRPAAGGLAQFGYVLGLSWVARREKEGGRPTPRSLVPLLLPGISLVDGVSAAILASPGWLWLGAAGAAATALGQRFVPGD